MHTLKTIQDDIDCEWGGELVVMYSTTRTLGFEEDYNPQLEVANELYDRLLKDDLTYSEYIDVKDKVHELKNN